MEDTKNTTHCYVPYERIYYPIVGYELNSPESNAKRYKETLAKTEFCAVISDLDGVILEKGEVVDSVLDSLVAKTMLNNEGKVPLAFATGRTLKEVMTIVIPKIQEKLKEKGKQLEEGDISVFASNGAVGYDVATGKILYEAPINTEDLSRAQEIEEVKILLNIVNQQSNISDEEGRKIIGRAKIIEDQYTFTMGIDPQRIKLIERTDEGKAIVRKFKEIYGVPDDLIYIAQRLNKIFEEKGIGLVATTSGKMIDINQAGVSKDLAVRIMRQIVAKKSKLPLSKIPPETILSIGDAVLGNDQYLTQRKGGFSNKGPILPGNEYPIIVDESENQFENSKKLFDEIKTKPIMGADKQSTNIANDYLVEAHRLNEGMPGKGIEYIFDPTGSIILDLETAKKIVSDENIPVSVRTFLASHFVVDTKGDAIRVMTRGKGYYEVARSTDEKKIYKKLLAINKLIEDWNIPPEAKLTRSQEIALLTLLDHAKAFGIRLLNTELLYSLQQENKEHIEAYMQYAQRSVEDYYRTLLQIKRKHHEKISLPAPHQTGEDDTNPNERIREMDVPNLICQFCNVISEEMLKKGENYDYIISPFYGAAELGFALKTMLEIKGMRLPEVVPINFSGAKARVYKRQKNCFYPDIEVKINQNTKILIVEDNSGTATTLRQLKEELNRYGPSVIDAAVVQAGIKRVVDVIIKERKKNYNRNIIEPEDIQYRAVSPYDLNHRLEQLEVYIMYDTLKKYLKTKIQEVKKANT